MLNGSTNGSVTTIALTVGGIALAKALLFGFICFLFSRYIERRITGFIKRAEPSRDPMLMAVGIGVVIAAAAGLLGFSLGIGALFAGLVFSRDPVAANVNASFNSLYLLLVPFFFIAIGLSIEPSALSTGLVLGGPFLLAALLGKVIGAGLPAIATSGVSGAALIGVSMVPRAEIAMIILQNGRKIGDWAMPPDVFAGMVMVTLATCLAAPIALRYMLARQQHGNSERG